MSTNDRLGGISFERFQESLKLFSPEDRERLEWLWGYYCNVLAGLVSAVCRELDPQRQNSVEQRSCGAIRRRSGVSHNK